MKIQHLVSSMAICLFALLVCSKGASAQTAMSSPSIDEYFTKVTTPSVTPDSQGFIRRWTLLEPIGKPNRSNTVFVDSYIREAFATEYFPNQMTVVPKDGDKVKVSLRFRGRERDYTQLGFDAMKKFADMVADYGVIEKEPKMEGRRMNMFLAPKKDKK